MRLIAVAGATVALGVSGCRAPESYRQEADDVAYKIIEVGQQTALGRTEPFTIKTPADTLRRRLLLEQGLATSHPASFGVPWINPVEHWPDDDYREAEGVGSPEMRLEGDTPLELSLDQALQVAAASSRDYQAQKESVFRAALALDLERDAFRSTWSGILRGDISTDLGDGTPETGTEGTGTGEFEQTLKSGVAITAQLAIDVATLLSGESVTSRGIVADISVSVPLMRGSGEHIVAEPLTQAQRDVVYAIWSFERFKRTFAVRVASDYLSVLQQADEVGNARENYQRLIASGRRARALADQGRLPEVQVDQAVQDELRARSRWISARQRYGRVEDSFKTLLGLPADAAVELDREELTRLAGQVRQRLGPVEMTSEVVGRETDLPAADAPVELVEPDPTAGGPYEMETERAVRLALEQRLDLRVATGEVDDAQRAVVVAADALLPEITLLGSADAGSGRSVGSAGSDDAELRFERGDYSGLLTIDLPFERTAERNAYRRSLIGLEQAVRDVQELEDAIKLDVRNNLRSLLESRENLRIQAKAAALAKRRVDSTSLLLELGRAEIRDLLESQEALIAAQNALTAALVGYRISELEMQRDLGVLEVNHQGLWREFDPASETFNQPESTTDESTG